MKALFRPFLSILFVLMLAGCSFSLPPNLPTTGGTPTPVNAGTQASTGLPVVTTETPSDIGGVPIEPTPTATLPPVATQTVDTVAGLPTAGPTITEQPTATQPAPALDSGAATSTPTATPAPTTAAGQGRHPAARPADGHSVPGQYILFGGDGHAANQYTARLPDPCRQRAAYVYHHRWRCQHAVV